MRSADEINALHERLEADIWEHGWDAGVDAASCALEWALGGAVIAEAFFQRLMDRPEDERREEWIRRGGDPRNWDRQEKDKP